MSSKLLRGPAEHDASPICWREMSASAPMQPVLYDKNLLELSAGAGESAGEAEALAEAEAEQRRRQEMEQARAAGFREGEAVGRERAAAEVRPLAERLTQSLEDLATLRPRMRQEAEGDMLRLAMAIARRVLRRELAVDPEALHGLAMAALEKLGAQEIHRVRVHASMVQDIRALLDTMPGRARVEVVPDPAGEPGSIVFETDRGNLDGSVETQLEEIERGLADRLRRKS